MCVMYVSFGCNVRPRTFGYVAMNNAVLFILRARLIVYSAGNLSGFSVRLLCFVMAKH